MWSSESHATANCDYKCTKNGGCSVQYIGPARAGNSKVFFEKKISATINIYIYISQGTCFPKSFGGKCRGTPRECDECNAVLTDCEEWESQPETRHSSVKVAAGQIAEMVDTVGRDNCKYECQQNGSCTSSYMGPPRAGPRKGSCYPESFGGNCSGIPKECQDCNRAKNCPEPSK